MRDLTAPRSPAGDDAGFTLVEVMIASAISLVVLVGLLGVLTMATRTQVFAQKQTDAFYDARGGIAQVQRDVTRAQGVTLPPTADPAFGTWMELAIVKGSGIDRVRYEVAGGQLVRKWEYDHAGGTYAQQSLLARNVANLTQVPSVPAFQCVQGAQLGTIAVQLLVRPASANEIFRLNSQLRPRNSFTYCG